ncbi:DUF2285 domain-containing protein [Inquilinus sp. CAU 1745]|uniref:DUF2285 domain-containing protein n=1 Tax=Inquilinus sp. CAU 1745 TaxID=3140369 RepID=UPI00325A6AD3
MFWAPEADPGTVILTIAPALPGRDGTPPAELDPVTVRLGDEGLHMVHGGGSAALHLLLLGDTRPGQPLAALLPLDADAPDRLDALARLIRGLSRPPTPPDTRLTAQRRRRLKHMLQALDGTTSGASYRDIAEVMFGAGRVASDPWKTSALRDAAIRLVRDGRKMVSGGYRQLLHRRRA